MQLETTQRKLMMLFVGILAVALLAVVFFETNIIEPGTLADRSQLEFVVVFALELLTLCTIPLALRLFKFGAIRRQMERQPEHALLRWGSVRLLLLGVLMIACVVFYYLFFMKATLGYLAIILLLSMMFVVPTRSKCEQETGKE